jgi:NAD(P)-dependent dehydrogenase (short-subunit alcohol dehydrogenase family)
MESVLITGVSRGLGKAMAGTFIKNGWKVYGLFRQSSHAPMIEHSHFIPLQADITTDDCEKIISSTLKDDSLRLLINNAGISGKSPRLNNVKPSDLHSLFETHCVGALRVTRACLPNLLKNANPEILNINSRMGSVAGQYSGKYDHLERSYEYRIAKAAQNMLSACLHGEFGNRVSILQVHPGRVKTATAQSDAVLEPSEAAEKIYELWNSGKMENGKGIYDAETGELYSW